MQFGERVRQLRIEQKLTQRDLAAKIGVSDTYISKVENENLHFGDFPSEKFIHKLADELRAEEEELLLLADKVPEHIRKKIRERPELYGALAACDNKTLDWVFSEIQRKRVGKRRTRLA